jgi:copper homeostasis protein
MIRPRAGDFIYSSAELDVMTNDIYFAASAGLAGVVFGASLADGRLDTEALITLCNAVGTMPRTLHRAFDLVPDMAEAIELAIECGFERILSSGRAASALEGVDDLAEAIRIADNRISIMPGAGVNLDTIDQILSRLAVLEVHSSCSSSMPVTDRQLVTLGFSEARVKKTDITQVRALKERLLAE